MNDVEQTTSLLARIQNRAYSSRVDKGKYGGAKPGNAGKKFSGYGRGGLRRNYPDSRLGRLGTNLGLNANTAIRSLRHMLNGERYSRALTLMRQISSCAGSEKNTETKACRKSWRGFPLTSTTVTSPGWQCPACRLSCRSIAASLNQGARRVALHDLGHAEAALGIKLSTLAPRSSIVRASPRSHDASASTAPEISLSRPRRTHSQTMPTRQPAASNA